MKLRLAVALLSLLWTLSTARAEQATGRIAAGTKWETPYYVVDSKVAGPTVVVTGGIHGNEPAGYRAAEQIRHWPIVKGRLIVLPKVNIPGLAVGTRYLPGVPEANRDLNRNFVLTEKGDLETRSAIATALWKFVRDQRPDWVLDLHEGMDFHVSHRPPKGKKRSVGSSIIYRPTERLDPLVQRALAAANAHVASEDRRFVPIRRSPVVGSFARAADVRLGANSMILETTWRDQPISLRTRQHRAMMNSLLTDIGLIDRDCSNILSPGAQSSKTAARALQVALFDGPGTGPTGKSNLPRIADAAQNIAIQFVGPADIQPDVVSQFDLLIFPGGSGSKQARALGKQRRTIVRQYVDDGGGYIGVCAGAYLCSAHYDWSLDLVDSSVFTGSRQIEGVGRKQMWYRGKKTRVDVELSDAGRKIFARIPAKFDCPYQNGPIISPGNHPKIEDYTPLAWFRSEKVLYEPQRGTMINTPAIVSGRFGEGRVISISPHPEADKALESIIVDSIRWVSEE